MIKNSDRIPTQLSDLSSEICTVVTAVRIIPASTCPRRSEESVVSVQLGFRLQTTRNYEPLNFRGGIAGGGGGHENRFYLHNI